MCGRCFVGGSFRACGARRDSSVPPGTGAFGLGPKGTKGPLETKVSRLPARRYIGCPSTYPCPRNSDCALLHRGRIRRRASASFAPIRQPTNRNNRGAGRRYVNYAGIDPRKGTQRTMGSLWRSLGARGSAPAMPTSTLGVYFLSPQKESIPWSTGQGSDLAGGFRCAGLPLTREVDAPQGEYGGRDHYPSVSLSADSSPDKGSLWRTSADAGDSAVPASL